MAQMWIILFLLFQFRYSQVAREVLAGNIPSGAYDVHMQLCQMVALLYSQSVKCSGWSDDNIAALESLAWSHAISAEEYYGLSMCTENLEYSTHLAEDLKRHSSPDNYSCEIFERAIRVFKQQTNNAKGIEKTFAERENIRIFIRRYELTGPFQLTTMMRSRYHLRKLLPTCNPLCFFTTQPLRQQNCCY